MPLLGAADYKLVHHAGNGRSAYSFCMCPGGTVVAATSEEGRVVTNGMSQYSRNERNANAAIVVGIEPQDFGGDVAANPLAGMDFQRHWEQRAFEAGGGGYLAPAQKVGDFLAGRPSTGPGSVIPSYTPGVHWTDLANCLPDYVIATLPPWRCWTRAPPCPSSPATARRHRRPGRHPVAHLEERLGYLRELEERRAASWSIEEQGKLTDALLEGDPRRRHQDRLEDLYLPYKPKRRTKAQIAREAGLEPLADALLADPTQAPEARRRLHDAEKGSPTPRRPWTARARS
jgi:hypothetical protein